MMLVYEKVVMLWLYMKLWGLDIFVLILLVIIYFYRDERKSFFNFLIN